MRRLAALLLAVTVSACGGLGFGGDAAPSAPPPPAPRSAWIVGADGRALGQAIFIETPGGVMLRAEFAERAFPSGWLPAMLAEHGDCSGFARGFSEAGTEFARLGNVFASPSGVFGAELNAPGATIAPTPADGRRTLLDADGTALLIESATGQRLACAALTPQP